MWQEHIDRKKSPENRFYLPGPGKYEGKHYMKDDPSFAAPKFQQAARPLN